MKSPTPYEIALLASRFLPKLEIQENWTESHPYHLAEKLHQVSVFDPEIAAQESRWEVLCEEALGRAQILLSLAEGKVRPEVQNRRTEQLEREKIILPAIKTEMEKWDAKFEALASGRREISLREALKLMLPRVGQAPRAKYYRFYMQEWKKRQDPAIFSCVPFNEEATNENYMIGKGSFPSMAMSFLQEFEKNKDTWGRRIQREAGKKGGLRTQAKKIASNKKGIDGL